MIANNAINHIAIDPKITALLTFTLFQKHLTPNIVNNTPGITINNPPKILEALLIHCSSTR